METSNSKDDALHDTTNSKDLDEDESFVTKVRSRVSGILSSSFSRLFKNPSERSGVVRLRCNEDDETNESQPPRKRARGIEHDTVSSHHFRDNNTLIHSEFVTKLNNESEVANTIVEPIAGPSFISRRSTQKTVSNASEELSDKDNHLCSEQTSGYLTMTKLYDKQTVLGMKSSTPASMIKPVKSIFNERKSLFHNSTPETPNRSLFAEQSLSPQDKNTSLSSRRPSFHTSNFSSPSLIDRTLTTNKIINSPFYSGSTIYGGASAYGRQFGTNETRQQQLKNSFMVKPINKSTDTKSFTSLSKTARRILDTLEQCSTPLSDVKKVPMPTRTDRQGLFSKYVAANPYQKNSKVLSNRELLVPSVSERLKMKQIQRLQDTTNEIRHIASSSNSNLNNEDYKIAIDNQQKHTNKMKSKITSTRTKAPTIEILDNYILNPVPLMIPENKFPKFEISEFNTPLENSNKDKDPVLEKEKLNTIKTNEVTIEKEQLRIDQINPSSEKGRTLENETNTNKFQTVAKKCENPKKDFITEYIFSKPLIIANNSRSIIAINNFKFSEPLSKKIKMNERAGEMVQKKCNYSGNNKLTNGNISCEPNLVDVNKSSDLFLQKFKTPEGHWECQTCLIRNKAEVLKCVACETPRLQKNENLKKDSLSSFGLQFTKKSDEWDCTTCLVRNKVQSNVCVACSTPRISETETNGIGNKLQKAAKDWECDSCWVRNKAESLKCVACESIRKDSSSKLSDEYITSSSSCQKCFNKINGVENKCIVCDQKTNNVKSDFPSYLKPSSDTWECATCLIRNKNVLKTCAACETPREKSSNEIKTETLSKKSDKWECPTCMVRNNSEVEKCPCCETAKPGITLVNKSNVNMFNFGVNKMQFSFGIPQGTPSSNPSIVSSPSSLFAKNVSETSTSSQVFKFGIVPETKESNETKTEQNFSLANSKSESADEKEKSSSAGAFEFKTPSVESNNGLPVFKFGTSSKESPKDTLSANPMFKFNPSKTDSKQNSFIKISSEDQKKTESGTIPISQSESDSSKPSFSFESKDTHSKDATSKPMFNFGSSSFATPGGGFNFNPVKNDLKQQSSICTDSQQLLSTNSGGTKLKNGGFNFGTNMNSNQAAVFSFGATQNLTESSLPKGGYDFTSAIKPTGGFNFTAPAPPLSDNGPKPFNFTGGSIPTFSANSTEGESGPIPVRKFKKALRRTQR